MDETGSSAATQPIGVTHVVAGLGPHAGGPSYSVPALATALARRGAAVRLRSVGPHESNCGTADGVIRSAHPAANGILGSVLRSSSELEMAAGSDAHSGAILHTHGLWQMPNIYPARLKRRSDRCVVIVHSPRGMLAAPALKISAWKKRPFWWLQQRSALAEADCIHATAMSEFEEIRATGLTNPVAVIPNGVDVPGLTAAEEEQEAGHVVLSLGRVHPKKGLDRLVRAWARIEVEFPSWRLRIVGPSEVGHDRELGSLARALGAQRVTIEGPIYEANAKLGAYRGARLFVLPTLNENFALTVAEALAAAVPVISTKGAPWAGLEHERCGWWIDHGVEPLVVALRHAMTIGSAELQAMGLRGRSWVARDFGWDRIAGDMLDVYNWLRSGGLPPACVRLD